MCGVRLGPSGLYIASRPLFDKAVTSSSNFEYLRSPNGKMILLKLVGKFLNCYVLKFEPNSLSIEDVRAI